MRQLVIATKNAGKLRELKRYLKNMRAGVVSLDEFEHSPRIVENGKTFKANASKKAVVTSRFTKGLVLADDSGLSVDALGGAPGVRSSRFAGPKKRDKDNNKKLLHLLAGLSAGKRQAKFICAVAIADNGRVVKVIEECCKGRIAFASKGRHGFGYDPLFLIPRYGKTFGELGLKTKDKMSHRSKALKKAREFLKRYLKCSVA
ncbi:MAG: RdgB/HAM1 family non-canonical purine NTP pyrophosphatase [Candidatus Omnitrophica bacterium]|nr:RdgB/HAM1 family non-canonical purine NTP pyrophosphatase [Candidatus Omnitrophota bacterium]